MNKEIQENKWHAKYIIQKWFVKHLTQSVGKRMFKPVECMPNEYFRCLFCSAHICHGHSYNGKCTLKIT